MTQKANFDQIRRQNRGIILQSLRQFSSIARVDLGRNTKLSPATVTSITSDLINEGLILEQHLPDPGKAGFRGRPKVFLALNGEAACIAGIKISVNKVEMQLFDYNGKKIDLKIFEINTGKFTEVQFIEKLIELLKSFCHMNKIPPENLTEIGISAQGVVNSVSGTIDWSPAFAVRNLNVKAPIENTFGVRCSVSNDSNMIANALHWKNPNQYSGTFAVIFMDYGVGGGIFINNRLFYGTTGAAAEIGHITHVPDGNLCRCGKKGCLEAYLSDYAIYRTAENLSGDYEPAKISVNRNVIAEVASRAISGDESAQKAFNDAGRSLGYGIARLIATLNLDLIVITGGGSEEYPLMESSMNESLNDAIVKELRHHVKIEVLPWQEDLIMTGLVASSLHHLDSNVFAKSKQNENTTTKPTA